MEYKSLKILETNFGIILASGSPRRVKLLSEAGINFKQIIPDIDETNNNDESPYTFATRIAEEKALSISKKNQNSIVIGCDTIVILDDEILGKPIDKKDALRMLLSLSGNMNIVCTAVAFAYSGEISISGHELTDVYFNNIEKEEIIKYIATKEPLDKAGAYGIQGMGAFLVDRIDGNLDNVIGLPCQTLARFAGEVIDKLKV